jgi:hypothetical protein
VVNQSSSVQPLLLCNRHGLCVPPWPNTTVQGPVEDKSERTISLEPVSLGYIFGSSVHPAADRDISNLSGLSVNCLVLLIVL